jgi:signal transduction histidine kinase
METDGSGKARDHSIGQCLRALHQKDRLSYAGKFVQGFVHNANGPLQNLTMLTEMILVGMDLQDRMFSNGSDRDKWAEILEKQRRRLTQMREQIGNLAGDLREFMQLHEIERNGTEIDINALLTRIVNIYRADLFFKHWVKSELRLTKNLPHIRILGRDMVPALFHIFENAMIAMKDSPRKELLVETSMRDKVILVRITDSGCGLPDQGERESLFELFESQWSQQKNDRDRKADHPGYGLYAARQLLLSYGFTVTLENNDAEGTSAIIRMPLSPESA